MNAAIAEVSRKTTDDYQQIKRVPVVGDTPSDSATASALEEAQQQILILKDKLYRRDDMISELNRKVNQELLLLRSGNVEDIRQKLINDERQSQSSIQSLQDAIVTFEQQAKEHEKDIARLKTRLQAENDKYKVRVENFESQIIALETLIRKKDKEKEAITNQIVMKDLKIVDVLVENNKLQSQIAQFNEFRELSEDATERNVARIDALVEQVDILEADKKALLRTIEDYKEKEIQSDQKVGVLGLQLSDQKARYSCPPPIISP